MYGRDDGYNKAQWDAATDDDDDSHHEYNDNANDYRGADEALNE